MREYNDIKIISEDSAALIIEHRRPLGLFLVRPNKEGRPMVGLRPWGGIDNIEGEAFCEGFDDAGDAVLWLLTGDGTAEIDAAMLILDGLVCDAHDNKNEESEAVLRAILNACSRAEGALCGLAGTFGVRFGNSELGVILADAGWTSTEIEKYGGIMPKERE